MASAQRVLILSEHPYPDHATVRRNVAHLIASGVTVDLVCLHGRHRASANAQDAPALHLHQLRMTHKRSGAIRYLQEYLGFWLWSFAVTFGLSLRYSYVAVLADNPPDFLIFVSLIARLRGARVVLEMFELVPELTMARMKMPREHGVVRALHAAEWLSVRYADAVIAVSRQCRDALVARGVDGRKVWVVPNTIPAPPPNEASPEDGTDPFIVTHCSLVERYGVQVAIRAMGVLRDRRPGLTLHVLGDGEYRDQLVALTEDLGLQHRVLFRGFLPWAEAISEIRRAQVGIVAVIADGYGELLLPTKLLEYADNQVPVACARLPTIADNFPADCLAYFEPGDSRGLAEAIERLLSDAPGALAQARRAKAVVNGLSWDSLAPRFMDALGIAGRPLRTELPIPVED